MKFYFSAATAAILCCGISATAVAQAQFRQSTHSPGILMTGIQVDSEESPLDFGFSADESQPDPQSLTDVKQTQVKSPVDSIIENTEQAERANAFTGTTANVGGQVLDGSHFAPLFWSQGSYSHNAFPDYMRLQWCADGLWDTFAAERAAQCALQYERISGCKRHKCGHCGHAGVHAYSGHCCQSGQHCGRGCGCGSATDECDSADNCPPVNRYRPHRRHACGSCGHSQNSQCQATGCQATGCGQCGQGACDSASPSILSSPATTSNSQPGTATTVGQTSANKIAYLPLTGNR